MPLSLHITGSYCIPPSLGRELTEWFSYVWGKAPISKQLNYSVISKKDVLCSLHWLKILRIKIWSGSLQEPPSIGLVVLSGQWIHFFLPFLHQHPHLLQEAVFSAMGFWLLPWVGFCRGATVRPMSLPKHRFLRVFMHASQLLQKPFLKSMSNTKYLSVLWRVWAPGRVWDP